MMPDRLRPARAHPNPSARSGGGAALWLLRIGALLVLFATSAAPGRAFDLFARHQVTVQLATKDGKPMANAEVRVFAPGEPNRPALTGRTDSQGKFEFGADKDGFWTAEAHNGDEVARVMVRVGGQGQQQEPLSPYWVLGGLLLLLILAFGFRIAQARARRKKC